MGIEKVLVSIDVAVGDTVKVIDGPFDNFMGVIEEINMEKQIMKVLISMFGRDSGRAGIRTGRENIVSNFDIDCEFAVSAIKGGAIMAKEGRRVQSNCRSLQAAQHRLHQ